MLRSIAEYLRHNKAFKSLFRYPLKLRHKVVSQRATLAAARYNRTVVAGEVALCPENIPGTYFMPATSHIAQRIILDGSYEPQITGLIDQMRWLQGDAINIGANVGLYSVFMATAIPSINRVYAVEPNPQALMYLRKNIEVNHQNEKITIIEALVASESTDVVFEYVQDKPEYSSIGGIVHPSVEGLKRQKAAVQARPLDDLLPADCRPSLLFVDTEGAELLVFRGARETIVRHSPIIVFECENTLLSKFGHDTKAVEDYFHDLGYLVRNAYSVRQRLQHPFVGEAIAFPADKESVIQSTFR